MQLFIDQQLHPIFIKLAQLVGSAAGFVWYYPVVILCLFCGVFFTFKLKFVQFKGFRHAIDLIKGKYDNPNEPGHISHFQALMAALSGTIGLGNIAGVAIAFSIGGPGTIFWMWLVGILGMATKFVECTLGTKYREDNGGVICGGPMYYVSKKCPPKLKPMAWFFSIAAVFGAFGAGGMFQANQAASALASSFNVSTVVTGLFLAVLVGIVIIGGIKRIGNVASKIVPSMCIVYIIGAIIICLLNITSIPSVLFLIIRDAFSGMAVAGGSIGTVIIWGVRRGIFSNEAGLGSAPIAHAAVKTNYPIREGLVASIGPFIDTVIVCTATAIVIILSGQYGAGSYTAKSPMINFENHQDGIDLTSSFSIQTKDDGYGKRFVYKTDEKFIQQFKMPQMNIVSTSKTWYGTSVSNVIGDGIQFSAKKNGAGKYAVVLRDSFGNKITSLKLSGEKKTFYVNSNKLDDMQAVDFSLTKVSGDNGWQTYTINFSDRTKMWVLENPYLHQVSLEFVMDKGVGPIEIDNIFIGVPKSGIDLTIASFDQYFKGFGSFFIAIAVAFFAFSTMITWAYYGEVALIFLYGKSVILPYKIIFMMVILLGAITQLSFVMNFTDLMIGLMVIPNSIAILYLVNIVYNDHNTYFSELKKKAFKTYK